MSYFKFLKELIAQNYKTEEFEVVDYILGYLILLGLSTSALVSSFAQSWIPVTSTSVFILSVLLCITATFTVVTLIQWILKGN
jgi:hypothetical protein